MLGRDGIAGIICLGLSIVMLVMTRDLPHSPLVPIGPDFYPRVVLSVGALLSAILVVADIVMNLRGRTAAATPSAAPSAKKNYALVVLTFIVFTVYVALLPWLGYRIATFFFVAVEQALLEQPRSPRRWVIVLITAVATSLVTYVVFEQYLQVLLPRGSWTGI
jgi:putative tricarboxylic transport membrane protein